MRITVPKAESWFIVGILIILLVPIIKVLVEYQTFIHPWRPELAGSVVLLIALVSAWRSEECRNFLLQIPSREFKLILLPCILFILWSGASALWAQSPVSALYHTAVWIAYLSFYCFFRFYTRDENSLGRWMLGLMAFLWIICLPPLIEYYANVATGNFTTIVARYSKYTEIANTVVPLVAAYSLQQKGRSAYIGYFTVGMVLLFDIATMSRAGIGVFVIAIAGLLVLTITVPSLKAFRTKAARLAAVLVLLAATSSAALLATVGNVPAVDRAEAPLASVSNSMRGLFYNIAVEMWRENPFLGVGADNYGIKFPAYRRIYARQAPSDPALAFADDQIAERAHNEYLQVLAELGTAGFAILSAFLLGICVCVSYLWRRRTEISLYAAAAIVGMAAFLASSLVTSYSFRLFQNGLMFFLVLAVAVGGTLGRPRAATEEPSSRNNSLINLASGIAIISSFALGAYSVQRVMAVDQMLAAFRSADEGVRARHFSKALKLDPENAVIRRAAGLLRLSTGDSAAAALYLRESIDRGQATTTDYSYLATAHILSDQPEQALDAINEALQQYPLSPFLHIRSGIILNTLGRPGDAEQHFARAREIDAGQAATWRVFLESGAASASRSAFENNGVKVMDLSPRNAIYAVQKERELRFPEEKFNIPQ